MKKLSLLLIFLFLILCSTFSFAQIHYVSNDGSSTGDGSFTNPFDKISTAYNAVSNGQQEVIRLMPGIYYETNLVFDYDLLTISGYGDQSIISNNIIVKSAMSFADLYIQGTFSNEAFAATAFNNVKCNDNNIDIEKISGTWRDSAETTHINNLIDPQDGLEAVNLDSMSNYVADAGFATEEYIDTKQMTTTNITDNAVTLDKLNTTSVDTGYLKKSGDTVTGNLVMDNAMINGKTVASGLAGGLYLQSGNSFYCNGGKIELPGADGNIVKGGNVDIEGGYSMMGLAGNVYIKSGGGSFPGSVNISSGQGGAGGNVIIHDVITPVNSKDAANKDYVDNKQFSSTNISTGAITVEKIASEAVTVAKLASDVDDEYVNTDGDTMTGPLQVKINSGFGLKIMDADNNPSLPKAGLYISSGGGGDSQLYLYDDEANLNALINSDGDSYMLGGRFGVGTIPAYGQLEIKPSAADAGHGITLYMGNGSTARSFLQSDGNGDYNWYLTRTSTLTKGITIDKNGNVGIATGSSTPQAKLDVNGKIKSAQTTSGDTADTVTTKSYVDNAVENTSFSNRSARVTIAKDVDYVQVMDSRVTTNSIIVVTPESPHDDGFYQYWVEPGTGSFNVYREPTDSEWKFNFFISKF